MAATSDIASLPAPKGGRSVTTWACSACLSGERPKSWTRRTPGSRRIFVSMALMPCTSAAFSGPLSRATIEGRDPVLRVLERLRQVLSLDRRRAGGEEAALVPLGDVRQPGEHLDRDDRDQHPPDYDRPAEADREVPDRGEDPAGHAPPHGAQRGFMPRIVYAMQFLHGRIIQCTKLFAAFGRQELKPSPATVECPEPEIAAPAVAVGAIERPAGQLHDAETQRLRRERQRAGSDHAQCSPLGSPALEQVEHHLSTETRGAHPEARCIRAQ